MVKHAEVFGLVWYSNGTVAMSWIGYKMLRGKKVKSTSKV